MKKTGTADRAVIIQMIQEFTGQANLIAIPRVMLDFFKGDYPTTIFASQLIYWQGKQTREDGAIFKTYAEWEKEIGLSQYQIGRAVKCLKPYLKTEIHKAYGNPTVHYYFNFDIFLNSFIKFLNKRKLSFFIILNKDYYKNYYRKYIYAHTN